MSKINLFALGGLDENGKNCYIIEIDNDIFVFECGLKYATENLFGIDYVIPDFSYLIKNKDRIKGLFLTHGHLENMGATEDLLRVIPNIPIYATKFTKFVLANLGIDANLITLINPYKKIVFDNGVSIFPLNVNHSTPDAVMYVINTNDGAICYTGDFIIDPTMMGAYEMDLGRIAYVGKQGVIALLCESSFSEKIGHTSPSHRLTSFYKDQLNRQSKRTIFLLLPTHLYTMQEIFNAAANLHRKIIIMGKFLQNIVSMAKQEGYLTYNDELLGDLNNIEDENAIILVAESKENPYGSINKIINNYDKYIKIKESDAVIFAEPHYPSSEKALVKVENELAMIGCKIINIPKNKNILLHASSEDLMLMINLLKPRYYMPVEGEYRYMVNNADLALKLNIPAANILLKQNGDIISIENGQLLESFEHIKVDDVLIDGTSTEDVGELVVKDREMLSESGIVLISATISRKDKIVLVGPEVTTRGFIYVKDSGEMLTEIKKICALIIDRNITSSYIEYNKIKNEIREELGKYLFSETECKPMIIAVIQEI